MPTDVPGNQLPQPHVRSVGPIISAARGEVFITGTGFLPNSAVTVRVGYSGEDIVDYLTYISGADGSLSAPLPPTAATDILHVTITDHRSDPVGDGGLLWSNTVIVGPDGA